MDKRPCHGWRLFGFPFSCGSKGPAKCDNATILVYGNPYSSQLLGRGRRGWGGGGGGWGNPTRLLHGEWRRYAEARIWTRTVIQIKFLAAPQLRVSPLDENRATVLRSFVRVFYTQETKKRKRKRETKLEKQEMKNKKRDTRIEAKKKETKTIFKKKDSITEDVFIYTYAH